MNTITKVNFDNPNQVTGLTQLKVILLPVMLPTDWFQLIGTDGSINCRFYTTWGVTWASASGPSSTQYGKSTDIDTNGYTDMPSVGWTYDSKCNKYTVDEFEFIAMYIKAQQILI